MHQTDLDITALRERLIGLRQVRIAVSGGVDSMTLALLAGRALGDRATVFHAVSAAVPAEATARVRAMASGEGWRLELIDAGELANPDYLRNPHDRCFHCKDSLYGAIAKRGEGAILSGANLDDLDDYRPGLMAATAHGVIHPFVECRIDKGSVRRICARLGHPELAQLPASPCLSSRIETGLGIDVGWLGFVHQVEGELRSTLVPQVVRCRVRADMIAVELDPATLGRLGGAERARWEETIFALGGGLKLPRRVTFEPYRMGSAFVRPT